MNDKGQDKQRHVRDSIVVDAEPAVIFAILANPREHRNFDGSETVNGVLKAPDQLKLGDTFTMRMRIGVPYTITNTVVEYDENRLIAWKHFGGHVWRYQLEASEDHTTTVTETFDYAPSLWPLGIELLGYPRRHRDNIAASLERLKRYAESKQRSAPES